jgi:uncharacterized protein (DUF927 family)
LLPDSLFSEDIRAGFAQSGDSEKERELLQDIFMHDPQVGVFLLMMFAAPIESRLNLPKFIVNLWGMSDIGKTTLFELGAMMMGCSERLVNSADSTKVGRELLFKLYNDLLIFIDELKTGAQDGKGIAKQLLSLIFNYTSGKAHVRGTIKLQLQHSEEFHEILFTSSNRSLESLLTFAETDTDGAHRRVLDVQVNALWHEESNQAFSDRYEVIKHHYGHVFPRWIQYLQQGGLDRIIEAFKKPHDIDYYNCKGTQRLLKLALCVWSEVISCLTLPFVSHIQRDDITSKHESLLLECAEKQQGVVDFHTEHIKDRFVS